MDEKVLDSGSLNEKKLIELAHEARKRAYTPYSHFQVGAALVTKQGKVYLGCNIENAAFGPSNCAERTAIFKAVSEGEKTFTAIAIVGGSKGKIESYCAPCGVCRQVMAEFCKSDFKIITAKSVDDYKIQTLAELLPDSFGGSDSFDDYPF